MTTFHITMRGAYQISYLLATLDESVDPACRQRTIIEHRDQDIWDITVEISGALDDAGKDYFKKAVCSTGALSVEEV